MAPSQYRKPTNSVEWESWCRVIFSKVLGSPNLQEYRVGGQEQHGIDLLGNLANGDLVGVQCKLLVGGVNFQKKQAEDELKELPGLGLKLKHYILATTSDKPTLQTWAAGLNAERNSDHPEVITVHAWPYFTKLFDEDQELCARFYPEMFRHGGAPKLFSLPELTSRYVHRPVELGQVHAIVTRERSPGAVLRAGFRGHGGQGKSTLALAYAHFCRTPGHPFEGSFPGGCYWLPCDRDSIMPEVAALAAACGAVETQNAPEAAANVKRKLQAGGRALLILDNVRDADQWNSKEFQELLPGGPCVHLVTTREPSLPRVEEVKVTRLSAEQSRELLDKYKPIPDDPAAARAAGEIVEWLGGLAVAVAAVGAYMRLTEGSEYPAYWQALKKKKVEDLPGGEVGVQREIMYERRAVVVIDDAIDALPEAAKLALDFASLLPPDLIPAPWLAILLEGWPGLTLTAKDGLPGTPAEQVVDGLLRDDVLRRSAEEPKLLTMHRLWHTRMREWAETDKRDAVPLWKALAACAISRREVVVGSDEEGEDRGVNNPAVLTDRSLRWELSPLLAVCLGLSNEGAAGEAVQMGVWLAALLRSLGRLDDALACLALLSANENAVLSTLSLADRGGIWSNLAMIQRDRGDLQGARGSMQRAIDIQCETCERDHPSLAALWSNFSGIQQAQGDFQAARESLQRALDIQLRHYGPDHPDLAIIWSNLSVILHSLGDPRGARESMERALKIDLKHLAPDHPNLAITWSNFAAIQKEQGDLSGARASIQRAIDIQRKYLDPEHPQLAVNLSNLSAIQHSQGDLQSARDSIQCAIDINLKHFDPDHPSLAITLSNRAMIQREQGDLHAARESIDRAIDINLKHFDHDHPSMSTSWSNLAVIQRAQGDLPGARESIQRSIGIDLKYFGIDHPGLAISWNNLASIEYEGGDRESASTHWREALRILRLYFGDEHPSTQIVLCSLETVRTST